ncbi:hypothetical protein B0F90DRAFT_1025267 [Multifurca ochricompacta]|uniref:Uncharacterized protein n=1 Tax=Multifurca ochricompacta TaxID=376703 RepID=A0AAD4QIH5_9AGAM|nr:hypothetical protein B0F90DRAFT_1025267 [Multifurca ochricompacta]
MCVAVQVPLIPLRFLSMTSPLPCSSYFFFFFLPFPPFLHGTYSVRRCKLSIFIFILLCANGESVQGVIELRASAAE